MTPSILVIKWSGCRRPLGGIFSGLTGPTGLLVGQPISLPFSSRIPLSVITFDFLQTFGSSMKLLRAIHRSQNNLTKCRTTVSKTASRIIGVSVESFTSGRWYFSRSFWSRLDSIFAIRKAPGNRRRGLVIRLSIAKYLNEF